MFNWFIRLRFPQESLGQRQILIMARLSAFFLCFLVVVYGFISFLLLQTSGEIQRIDQIKLASSTVETAQSAYDLTDDSRFLVLFKSGFATYVRTISELHTQAAFLPQLVPLVAQVIASGDEWRSQHGQPLVQLAAQSEQVTSARVLSGQIAFDAFRQHVAVLQHALNVEVGNASQRFITKLLIIICSSLLMMFWIGLWTIRAVAKQFRAVTEPIHALTQSIIEFRAQGFAKPLEMTEITTIEIRDLATEIEVMREQLYDSFRTNQLILDLVEELQSSLEVNRIFHVAVMGLCNILDCELSSIMVATDDGQYEILGRNTAANFPLLTEQLRIEEFQIQNIFQSKQSIEYQNWSMARPGGQHTDKLFQMGIQSSLHLPIVRDEEVVAVLNLGAMTINHFTSQRLAILHKLLPLIALAMFNAQAYESYARLATVDSLTGVWNRRYMEHTLSLAVMDASGPDGAPLSIAMLDLDHFKRFNDTYGHPEGDRLLCHVAKLLQDHIRPIDVVARYGGEEFIVIFLHTQLVEAQAATERLRLAVLQQHLNGYFITASFGVTQLLPNDTIVTLIQRADDALYQAKKNGRNQVVTLEVADSEM